MIHQAFIRNVGDFSNVVIASQDFRVSLHILETEWKISLQVRQQRINSLLVIVC